MSNDKLEMELGRFKKKVSEQQRKIKALQDENDRLVRGAMQTGAIVDALFATVAMAHGESVPDEETGEVIGHRLSLPLIDVEAVRSKYFVQARRSTDHSRYIIDVVAKDGC